MKMTIFSTLWTSWKWRRFLEVWRACSDVLHSLYFQLFTLPSLPPFAVNFYLLKVCHPSWVSFSVSAISLRSWSSPPGHLCYFSNSFFFCSFHLFPLAAWALTSPAQGGHHCTGCFSASCMWPAWVSFLCAPSGPKAPLVPLRELAWLLHFWTVLPFPVPLHMLDADQLPFPPPSSPPPFPPPPSPPPPLPHHPVIWQLPSLSLCRALQQFQPCLFHTEFCTLFYRCSSSKLTAHFPPCLPLISAIFVNKFWWHYFL